MTDGINGLALICNLVVDHQEVLQSLVHIALVSLQALLLNLNLIAHLLLFLLQSVHGGLLGCGGLLGGGGFLGTRFFCGFLGRRLPCLGLLGSTSLRGSGPLLLSWNRCHEAHQ